MENALIFVNLFITSISLLFIHLITYSITPLHNKIFNIMNYNKIIYEGWTIKNFIDELQPQLDMIMSGNSWKTPLKNRKELKEWCIDNQPYYKKEIPEVISYFSKRYGI